MGYVFRNLMFKFQRFMGGRYGFDELGKFSVIFALVLYGVSTVFRFGFLYYASLVLLLWSYYRCFSKKIYKRRQELNKYMVVRNKVAAKFRLWKQMWIERHMYKYFKCPKCKSTWRFPKGKGKIEITCRTCKTKMIKKT